MHVMGKMKKHIFNRRRQCIAAGSGADDFHRAGRTEHSARKLWISSGTC